MTDVHIPREELAARIAAVRAAKERHAERGGRGALSADELDGVLGQVPQLPQCPKCGRRSHVHHFGEWSHEGKPERAWFECVSCEYQWTDFALSTALLGTTTEPQ